MVIFSSIARRITASALAAAVITGLSGAAQALEMVVIDETNSAFSLGQVIDGTQTLSLLSGVSVKLLSANGDVVSLTGPYSGSPAPAGAATKPGVVESIRDLLQRKSRNTSTVGAIRGVKRSEVPEPWAISIEISGNRCLPAPNGGEAYLWRGEHGGTGQLRLTEVGAAQRSWSSPWQSGHSRMKLPPTRFRDGGLYSVSLKDENRLVRNNFTMRIMPAALTDTASQIAWMVRQGCEEQAWALIRKLAGTG